MDRESVKDRQGMPPAHNRVPIRDIAVAGLVILGTMVVLVVLLRLAGLLAPSRDLAGATIVASSIALVGTFFTAVIGFVGVILKHSIDLRSMSQQAAAQVRSLELQQNAEDRLRLETAVKAVELFGTATAAQSQPQTAGALFALAQLGQHEFALGLLESLWPAGRVDSPSAVWVLNQCLLSSDQHAQNHAAELLSANAGRLYADGTYHWPAELQARWDTRFSWLARADLLTARARLLLAAPKAEWNSDRLLDHAAYLSLALVDPDPIVVTGAVSILKNLLPVIHAVSFATGSGLVDFAALRARVAALDAVPGQPIASEHKLLAEAVARWANAGASPPAASPAPSTSEGGNARS
jgi:hypothetical protein